MTISELYDELYNELLSWCRMLCGNNSLAEELVQEGFFKAVTNSEIVLSLNKYQQRAWLYKTIKNLFLNSLRHSSRELNSDTVPELSYIPHEYGMVEIEQIVNILPDEERMLFIMRYFQGYNSSELGNIFNLSPGTVRSRLFSARPKLKKYLKPKGDHHE